jgi:hypothetical protein
MLLAMREVAISIWRFWGFLRKKQMGRGFGRPKRILDAMRSALCDFLRKGGGTYGKVRDDYQI